MTKEKKNLRDELRYHKFEFDLLQKVPCTKQENKAYSQILKQGELFLKEFSPTFTIMVIYPRQNFIPSMKQIYPKQKLESILPINN